jgi:selenocysteine lyase/cysteine desulfurase
MRAKIGARTRLVAVGGASNALGTVNDLAAARELSRAVSAWLLVDAVHLAPHFSIDVGAMEPDFLLCSAYKLYGPHVGILYARPPLLDELPVDRLRTASSAAPERIETGTSNHAAIAGVRAAIEYLASWGSGADLRARLVSALGDVAAWERSVAEHCYESVRAIPGVTVWGPDFGPARRAPTLSLTVDGVSADEAAAALAARGIAVWSGDFYARRAVEVLGLAERGGLLRIGALMYNTRQEIDRLADALRSLAER